MLRAVMLVVVLGLLHLRFGAATIDFTTIWHAVVNHDPANYLHAVVVDQRLTRLAVAAYCGAALGLSGYLLQKVLQNGLVSPSTLGISAGAVNVTVLSMMLWPVSGAGRIVPSFIGGVAAVTLTFALARVLRGQGDARLTLALAGSMVATLFSSLTTFALSLDPDGFDTMLGWLIGTIGNFDHLALLPMMPIGGLAFAAAMMASRAVDMLVLGDDQAAVLGLHVPMVYAGALGVAILLAVSAVTVVGPIGFVGLVVPHMVRLLAGETGRQALCLAVLLGAAVLIGADILARTVLGPRVLNVGTVMGLAGGAVFLILVLVRARGRV